MAYKKLIKVSNVCQLFDKRKFLATQTINGVTFTNNGNGTITVNGTATGRTVFRFVFDRVIISKGAKLRFNNALDVEAYNKFWVEVKLQYTDGTDKYIADVSITPSPPIKDVNEITGYIIVNDGETVNETLTPQLFYLTEMYGAGNEPTTAEQFRQDFPEEMYDYSPHCWLTSYKRNLVCETKNLLPYPYYDGTKTVNGVTYTDNGNGTINLSGTSTGQANYYFSYGTLNLKKGVTYTLSASGDYSCSGSFTFYIYNSTYGQVCYIPLASSNSVSFTPSQDINGINCYIVVPADRTVSGTLKPILELGSTATDYVPYGYLTSYQRNLTCKTKNLFDINSAVKVSGVSSFSKNGNQITVSHRAGYSNISANVLLDTSLVGKTVTFSAYAKTSDKNTAYLRIQWLAPNGLASTSLIKSNNVSGQEYQKVSLTGVIPAQPDDEHNKLCLSFYSNGNNVPLPSQVYTVVYTDIQLELGDTATDYVPYGHL